MTYSGIRPGQIWKVRGFDEFVLIARVWHTEPRTQSDVRVVPLYDGLKFAHVQTDNDVRIPGPDNTLWRTLLATCWNCRSWPLGHLERPIGELSVGSPVLEAIQVVEMGSLLPVRRDEYRNWTGTAVAEDEDDEPRINFQCRELERWDAIERALFLQVPVIQVPEASAQPVFTGAGHAGFVYTSVHIPGNAASAEAISFWGELVEEAAAA